MMLLLLACAGADSDSVVVDTTCAFSPVVSMSSPTDGAVYSLGDAISLEATGDSKNSDASELRYTWGAQGISGAAAGESDTIATGASASWTPAVAGGWRITVQVEDACTSSSTDGVAPGQDRVDISVE